MIPKWLGRTVPKQCQDVADLGKGKPFSLLKISWNTLVIVILITTIFGVTSTMKSSKDHCSPLSGLGMSLTIKVSI